MAQLNYKLNIIN